MEPAALPAARIRRRPDEGGAGKCGCRQLAGCAAATAARNRSSRRAREDAVTVFGRKRCAACHGEAMFRPLRFASALPLLPSPIQPAKGFNVPRDGGTSASGAVRWLLATRAGKRTSPSLSYLWPGPKIFRTPPSVPFPTFVSSRSTRFYEVGNKRTLVSHDPSRLRTSESKGH
jgi:hypothetical protein